MVASAMMDDETKSGEAVDLLEAAMMQDPGSEDDTAAEMRLGRFFSRFISRRARNRIRNAINRVPALVRNRIDRFLQVGGDGGNGGNGGDVGTPPVTEDISAALNAALMQEPEDGDDKDMNAEVNFLRRFIRRRLSLG